MIKAVDKVVDKVWMIWGEVGEEQLRAGLDECAAPKRQRARSHVTFAYIVTCVNVH